jgi:cellulose synthase/poly-beta-1,6-N-acetylglucosamine synthase-like glycosyltransferase
MTDPVFIFYFILSAFGFAYAIIIGMYTLGWFRLKTENPPKESGITFVSIIIPCRNEEENIGNLLTDLVQQDFPANRFEIIVIDDNSTDHTKEKVNAFVNRKDKPLIKLLQVDEDGHQSAFKKNAIQLAIQAAAGELIITTDADCRVGMQWLSSIAGFYETEKPKMIVGPVSFHNEQSWFEKIQTIEFLSLIGITAGAISIGRPIMCNGANLAYEKKSFHEVGGFGNDSFSSGDDVFLLLKIKKHFGNKSVRFLKNKTAFVFTEAKKNINEFLHQRTRWASKNKGYDVKILAVSFTVFMVNFLLTLGLIWGAFNVKLLVIILVIYLLKLMLELPILLGIMSFAHRGQILWYGLPLILFYPVYIIVIGTMGIVSSYQWKGRRIKK